MTTTAFLEYTIAVCRAKRAAIVSAAVLYPLFFAFMLVWRHQTLALPSVVGYLLSGPELFFLGVTGVLAVAGRLGYMRLGTELDNLRAMQRRFDEQGDSPMA